MKCNIVHVFPLTTNLILSVLGNVTAVVIVTRHGTRTPLHRFPGKDPAFWKCDPMSFNFNRNGNISDHRLNVIFDVKRKLTGTCFAGQLAPEGY